MIRVSLLVTVLLLLLGCIPGDRIAGSKGGSETTNGITACIRHGDGTPAQGSIVRLRKSDYVSRPASLAKTLADSLDVLTDREGRFMLRGIQPGSYCIEVNDTAERDGSVLLTCNVTTSDTADLGIDSLHPYAIMSGRLDTIGLGGRMVYAQVRGLERLSQVKADGSFAFHDLPGGGLGIRIVEGGASVFAREVLNVPAVPGDTVKVRVSGTSPFSGYIHFETADSAFAFSGAIVNFPLLIRFDSSTFDFSRALPHGDDVRFTKPDGTALPFEIEQWDPVTGRAEVWVRIDTVFGNRADQGIVMQWGDTNARNGSNGAAVFDTAQGFAGVWHLNENPASGSGAVKDRTANGHNGTAASSMTIGNVVAGMIGPALRLDGADDYINAGVLNLGGSYTLSCWINADDLSTARRFIWKEYSYTLWYDAIGGGIRIEHFTDSLIWRGIYQDKSRLHPIKADAWYYLAGTYDGDKIRLYVNGTLLDSTQTIGADPHASQEPLSLGGRTGEFVKGVMDEVRIENRARPADWIRFCYRSQKPEGIVAKCKR